MSERRPDPDLREHIPAAQTVIGGTMLTGLGVVEIGGMHTQLREKTEVSPIGYNSVFELGDKVGVPDQALSAALVLLSIAITADGLRKIVRQRRETRG